MSESEQEKFMLIIDIDKTGFKDLQIFAGYLFVMFRLGVKTALVEGDRFRILEPPDDINHFADKYMTKDEQAVLCMMLAQKIEECMREEENDGVMYL